ncbi:MAG: TMEM14 family protein [Verrucomicrobia bacterium]|nr:TMEM14 family protein [Verrucomicrobiota bacterium]
MKTLARWTVAYGLFLIACGLAGYLSNPEKAKTALISGGTFGAISMIWGWLMARRITWSRWAAVLTTALLSGVFAWRATVGWISFADGASGKFFAAFLITLMGLASITMLAALIRPSCSTSNN